ncbi:MAG: tRNA uridine-5-carboxymethylaminomethyl(34) synthesis enzyme MnmG [Thermomicrobiales bacterium]
MQTVSLNLPIHFDVVIVGSGHAGCEAGLAAARAGCRTLVITPNLDRVGYMPCNPSIGGPGKSHIVAEVDAMGGAMAKVADKTSLHVRMLNTSKGPAVQAKRSQQDKGLYALAMKETLELQPNLELLQDEAIGLEVGSNGEVTGVVCRSAGRIHASAVVITAGTFLRGALISGESRTAGARAGDRADAGLGERLFDLGFQLRRLKTGTPPRVDGRTLSMSECERQDGDESPIWLSHDGELGRIEPLRLPALSLHVRSDTSWRPQLACLKTATQPATHDLIRANLHRAPMFNGSIEGVGPRYCPSIEDKVARFADKTSHPIFLEPEGWRTTEYYVQGMSTSLPPEVQELAVRTIPGMERARLTRFGYAVEYDAVDPIELSTTLESRRIGGLFLAGQVNGTSGYEEAAGQGILAGMNAAAVAQSRPQTSLARSQAYIGVMVDDLANRPFDEPYRMLTSRCEHRLLLRPDTARERLGHIAYQNGLIGEENWKSIEQERDGLQDMLQALESISILPRADHLSVLNEYGVAPVSKPTTATELLRRPESTLGQIVSISHRLGFETPTSGGLTHCRVENEVRYGAFLARETKEVARQSALRDRSLPDQVDYRTIPGLRIEAANKLALHRPRTIGEAGRLAGVTPSDIGALLIYLRRTEQEPALV